MQARKFFQELFVTALISLTIFAPFIEDLSLDLCFVIYLTCSFLLLVTHERLGFILPTYLSSTALAVVVLPFVYKGVPTLLRTSAFLVLCRAWHVGLLTSRGGYATDVSLYRSNALFTTTLTIIALATDCLTTFAVMHLLGYPNVSAALMATISPAPSPEVALPLFNFMTSSCTRAIEHSKVTGETEKKRTRLGEINEEMASALNVFKTTSFPLIFITIAAFCCVASGVNPRVFHEAMLLDVSGWDSMALNALIGLGVAFAFSVLFYFVGRLFVPKDVSPQCMASLLVCTASFSMFFVGAYAPVAAALAAIGACLCLRWSTGFNEQSSSILSMIWPYTSLLYYSTFVYVVVGYFTLHKMNVLTNLWKMSLASLVVSLTKLILITSVSRGFKMSWPSSLTLALSLCSKGTVQIALCALLPLKVALKDYGNFVETVFDLQLFVLLNYLVILPLIYATARLIVAWMWRQDCSNDLS